MKSIESVDMKNAVEHLKEYVGTYENQGGWEKYRPETYVDDILYGLGISISDDFKFAGGFDRFKEILRDHLREAA
jgi:hypothetical protein